MKLWIIYWLGLKASQAFAQSTGNPPPGEGVLEIQNPLGCNNATECVQGILNGLIKLAAPVVAVMILVGGFQIMASSGNEEKLKSGKNTIIYAVVGFAIILLASGVTAVIRDAIGQAP
jgi:hypothetical protein